MHLLPRSRTIHSQSIPLTLYGTVLKESHDLVSLGLTFHGKMIFDREASSLCFQSCSSEKLYHEKVLASISWFFAHIVPPVHSGAFLHTGNKHYGYVDDSTFVVVWECSCCRIPVLWSEQGYSQCCGLCGIKLNGKTRTMIVSAAPKHFIEALLTSHYQFD